MPRVLIVDDEVELTQVLQAFLARRGFEVWTAGTGEDALPLIRTHQPEVMLLDLRLGGSRLQGLDVLRRTPAVSPNTMVIVISACSDPDTQAQAMRLGARRYFGKPFGLAQVLTAIRDLTQVHVGGVPGRASHIPNVRDAG